MSRTVKRISVGRALAAATALVCLTTTARAQSTGELLPVNQTTTLRRAGTEDLAKSTRALQGTLTELQALQLQTKQAHWNVSGSAFYQLHLMLQEHYEGIAKYADEVAERLLAVGSSSDGRAVTIVQTSALPEIPGGFIDDSRVLTFFTNQYGTVGGRIHARIQQINDVDPTSSNLLQEVEHGIEKYLWQSRAFLQPASGNANTADLNDGRPVQVPQGDVTPRTPQGSGSGSKGGSGRGGAGAGSH